ncbi:MAG: outer membrane lipid asymmetry maintenance protein MlaD [Saccharospirillaceae bacterium]|nr:outer membrane lipid asymmetry maintenance protein MlaD [Colwellia sp.]NRB77322.1 outer membrane lipid asymmetry maintenance protein MlaD [Saccharospirillaceae bacterium]
MKKMNVNFIVGLFMLFGMATMAYLSVTIAGVSGYSDDSYQLVAKFDSSSGLKEGAFIEIAGVKAGKVISIELDKESFESVAVFVFDSGVILAEDTIASIRTSGIIGDKFVKISPGASDELLKSGDEIIETESSISIEELVSKYIFSSDSDNE